MGLLVFAAALPAHAWETGRGPGWFILIPIFWIRVIGTFIFFSRRRYWRHRMQGDPTSAEGVLRERYTRWDIDETEYRKRLDVLRSNRK
ncbi:hypothetical protein FQ154_03535 [Paeniglutamicibacter gangotriensis]|uniref:SHOCT domain-containing protein n=1 Tax=Paeniglutamicibacter gangotriensis TaxID=254787 RepID=A0A5B0EJ52_9MICC|nr:hypothetical protein FQ154_03535 [Paeniglutamicibacter gangotriensis]